MCILIKGCIKSNFSMHLSVIETWTLCWFRRKSSQKSGTRILLRKVQKDLTFLLYLKYVHRRRNAATFMPTSHAICVSINLTDWILFNALSAKFLEFLLLAVILRINTRQMCPLNVIKNYSTSYQCQMHLNTKSHFCASKGRFNIPILITRKAKRSHQRN